MSFRNLLNILRVRNIKIFKNKFHTSQTSNIGLRDYKIEKVLFKNNREKITDFMKETYLKDDPSMKAIGLTQEPNNPEYQDMILKGFPESYCIVAISQLNDTEEYWGFCASRHRAKGYKIPPNNYIDPRVRDMKKLWDEMEIRFNIFEHYKTDNVWDVDYLCVDPKFRGKGVAFSLVRFSLCFALKMGIPVTRGIATGEFSAHIFRKLAYTEHLKIEYDTYKNEKGETIFKGKMEKPHNAIYTFARKV